MKPRNTPPRTTSLGSRLPKALAASALTLCAGVFALHGAASLMSDAVGPGQGVEQEGPSPTPTTQDEKALSSSTSSQIAKEESTADPEGLPQDATPSTNAPSQQKSTGSRAKKTPGTQEVTLLHHTKAQVTPVVLRIYHPAGRSITITTAKGVSVKRQLCPQCNKHHDKGFWEEVVTGHETRGCAVCGKKHDEDFTEEVPVDISKASDKKG